MNQNNKCPFLDQYEEEETLFCLGCINLMRMPEYNYTARPGENYIASICVVDAMIPNVLYEEIEPVMPWE